MKRDKSIINIFELAKAYMASRIFLSAFELGIFEKMGNRKLDASEIASGVDADLRATEILLNALTSLGLIGKEGNRYCNVVGLGDALVLGGPKYQGGAIRHLNNLWKPWSHLTEIIRNGAPLEMDWTQCKSKDLALAMRLHGKRLARKLDVFLDFSRINTFLDLGSGPGSCSISLVNEYSHLKGTLFDNDAEAIQTAKTDIAAMNIKDRMFVRKGNFFLDDLGSGYDLVLMSLIISLFGEDEIAFLLAQVKNSLNPNGQAVICDFIMDESATKPATAAIFAVNMLVNTSRGRTYRFSEIRSLLQSAGFKAIRRIPLDDFQLVVGEK